VWWQKVGSTYRFFDGDGDADFSEQGPRLLHFHSTSLGHIQAARIAGWEKLISENSSLPAVAIRVYDETGNLHSIRDLEHDSPMANAYDLEESATDASFMMTPAKEPRAAPITSTPTAGEHLPLAVEMPVSVEENEAQDNDTVEENGGQVILVDDTNAVEAEGQQVDLDTKLGKALQQVLGDSEDLNRFDKLQRRLKVKSSLGSGCHGRNI